MTEAFQRDEIWKLGVFDSGLGGLTVLQELLRVHPGHHYVYFGDTAHVPYGSRSAGEVITLVSAIANYLVDQGCQGLILACNTSSALALPTLRAQFEVPIVGVIETAATQAAQITIGRVSVLANPLTANSGVYGNQIRAESERLGRDIVPEVTEIGCKDLVAIVENDLLYTPESAEILAGYAEQILAAKSDTLVLGCTHFPLLLPVLGPMLGPDIRIVNPADLIPTYLKSISGVGEVQFRVSGDSACFDRSAQTILHRTVTSQTVKLRVSGQVLQS